MRTLFTSCFNIVSVLSSILTVIRLSATLLYTFLRWGVSNSAPNGCPSRAMACRARVCISVGANDEGGKRDTVFRRNNNEGGQRDATLRGDSLNGRTRQAMNLDCAARVCGGANGTPEGPENNGNSPSEEDPLSVFSSGVVSTTHPTGCRLRRKSIHS